MNVPKVVRSVVVSQFISHEPLDFGYEFVFLFCWHRVRLLLFMKTKSEEEKNVHLSFASFPLGRVLLI